MKKNSRLVARVLSVFMCITLLNTGTVYAKNTTTEHNKGKEISECTKIDNEYNVDLDDIPVSLTLDDLKRNGSVKRVREDEYSLNSVVYQNIDGSYTEYQFTEPVKYQDENGKIKDIKLGIKDGIKNEQFSSNEYYACEDNDVKVYFPKSMHSSNEGVQLVKDDININILPSIDEDKVRYVSEIVEDESSNTVVYEDVMGEDTSLKYTPTIGGYKEEIILDAVPETNEFNFIMKLEGVWPCLSDTGSIWLKDKNTDEVCGEIESIYVYDSAELIHETFDNYYIIEEIGIDEYEITMIVDNDFLTDKNTIYPVIVDPTVNIPASVSSVYSAVDDTILYSGTSCVGKNYGKNYYAHIGYVDSTYGTGSMLIKFPGLKSSQAYTNSMYLVKSAVFYGTKVGGPNAYTASVSAYEYTGTVWDENTVTYNSAKISTSTGSLLKTVTMVRNEKYAFDITNLVKRWKNGTSSIDKGIILKNSTNNSNSNYTRVLATSEYAVNVNATAMPYVAITYYTPANISNGYYFAKNIHSGRYMDIEGPSKNSGAIIQQWEFHGGRQSQFLFTKQSDGTYTIKSLYSNMYVGVENNSSTSSAKIKQYSTCTSTGTKWVIYVSSNGNYILMPKCSLSTECALSLPSSSNSNGTDLIQLKYYNDSNMRDEWCLSRFIPNVPCEIYSNSDHYCIPTAISHIAAYWGRNGYSGFGGLNTQSLEQMGVNVQTAMHNAGLSDNPVITSGEKYNKFIQVGFDIFSANVGTSTYRLQSTAISPANWETLKSEINAGRPLMLGFAYNVYGGGHSTVCVGYEQHGSTKRVILSDGHNSHYVIKEFDSPSENDFMATVKVVKSN